MLRILPKGINWNLEKGIIEIEFNKNYELLKCKKGKIRLKIKDKNGSS